MPEALVVEAPITPSGIDFGIPSVPVEVTPGGGGDDRPRDERGRFVAEPEVKETPEPEANIETPEKEDEGFDPVVEPVAGLTLDDDVAPTFGLDGKFVGGKYLGKYDTLDDALVGFKSARRELARLQTENNQLRTGVVSAGDPPPYVFDPHSMTPEQLDAYIAKEVGEMTTDERIEFDENPVLGMAKLNRKIETARERITKVSSAWEKDTIRVYTTELKDGQGKVVRRAMDSALVQDALNIGGSVYSDFSKGYIENGVRKYIGPAEIRLLIGLGQMVREGKMLSDDQPVTRKKPVGRGLETRASVPVRSPSAPSPHAEADAEYKAMQHAAYGV